MKKILSLLLLTFSLNTLAGAPPVPRLPTTGISTPISYFQLKFPTSKGYTVVRTDPNRDVFVIRNSFDTNWRQVYSDKDLIATKYGSVYLPSYGYVTIYQIDPPIKAYTVERNENIIFWSKTLTSRAVAWQWASCPGGYHPCVSETDNTPYYSYMF